MIPQRTLKNRFTGSELNERVTACRKRLRVNRFTPKPDAELEFDEDSGAPKRTFLDDESAMRESMPSTDSSPAMLDGGNERHEVLLTMAAQGVGIT